jgi:shikimate dehydrogenase
MPTCYGLIGYPLSHSFSHIYFSNKFKEDGIDAMYDLFPLADVKGFPALLAHYPGVKGLNVTIPHKETIIPYLDELDELPSKIGAVNCIAFKNGIKKGYNTDVMGFEQSIIPLLKPWHDEALILGTGGASKAVAYVLGRLGIAYKKVSRTKHTGDITYSELTNDIIAQHKLIINASPAGKYPEADTYPALPYSAIGQEHLLYDLIYNPEVTKFLSLGQEQGAAIKNGYEMLILQAEAAWEIWNR